MSSDSRVTSTSPSTEEPQVDRATAHVGLVCSSPVELKPLIERLDRRRRYSDGAIVFTGGFLDETIRVAVAEAGAGFANHRQAALTLTAEHRPAWVISAGFSSSLSEDVRAGDLCLATSLRDTHGQQLAVSCPIPESPHATLRTHLVTDRHPRSAAEKQQLAADYDAGAVDTTSLAVAQVCQDSTAGFLSIRAVIDGVAEELPGDAVDILFEPSSGQRNPIRRWASGLRQSPDVKASRTRAVTASQRLDRFLIGVIRQLSQAQRT